MFGQNLDALMRAINASGKRQATYLNYLVVQHCNGYGYDYPLDSYSLFVLTGGTPTMPVYQRLGGGNYPQLTQALARSGLHTQLAWVSA